MKAEALDLSSKPAFAPELVQEGNNVKLALINIGEITAIEISLTPIALPNYGDGSWTIYFDDVPFLQPRDQKILSHKNRSSLNSSALQEAIGWTGERPLWSLDNGTLVRVSFRDQNGRRYSQAFVMEKGLFRIGPVELCREPTAEDLDLKILETLSERSHGEFWRVFFSDIFNQTQPPNEWLLEGSLQHLADDGYIEIRKARKTPKGGAQFESYRKGMEMATFIHEGGNFEIRITPRGLRQYESLKQIERSNLGFPLVNTVVSEEGLEKQPMKSNVDNHTLANCGAVAYRDRASNNTAITGPVEGDVNIYPSPAPPGSVHEHKAIKEYEAALQVKKAVLRARDAMFFARSTSSGTDFQSKLKGIAKSMSALREQLREAEVYWGEKVWDTSKELERCALKLKQGFDRHERYTRQPEDLAPSFWAERIDNIIWENVPGNDPFTREIEEAVGQILSFLDPYLLNPSRD